MQSATTANPSPADQEKIRRRRKNSKKTDQQESVANYATNQKGGLEVSIDLPEVELVEEKGVETEDKCYNEYGWVPFGVTSFAQYDAYQEATDTARMYRQQVYVLQDLISNIMYSTEVDNKTKALTTLITEFADRVGGVENKEVAPTKEPEVTANDHFMVWKEANGTYRWLAIYSNHFEDDDKPSEVIAEKAHKAFVHLANEGEVPMPELWHAHIEGTRWGVAEHLMYEDGFAVALGVVDKGHEAEAEATSKLKGLGVSHGMWKKSIVRDPADPSVIEFYISREISDLPIVRAANKLTGFVILPDVPNEESQD